MSRNARLNVHRSFIRFVSDEERWSGGVGGGGGGGGGRGAGTSSSQAFRLVQTSKSGPVVRVEDGFSFLYVDSN